MSTIYLHQNVPSVYTEESRDFQLFCRLYSLIENGVKYNIDSVANVIDSQSCDIYLLQLLQSKVGFFTKKQFSDEYLRVVLEAFPYLIKNKGNKTAIIQAVNVFLKLNNLKSSAVIEIINKASSEELHKGNEYLVKIGVEAAYLDTTILSEMLKYLLPTGYDVYYYFYASADIPDTNILLNDIMSFRVLNKEETAHVINSQYGKRKSLIGVSDSYSNPQTSNTVNVIEGYYKDGKFYSDAEMSTSPITVIGTNDSLFFKDLNYRTGTKLYVYVNQKYELVKPILRIKVPSDYAVEAKYYKKQDTTDGIGVNDGYIFDDYEGTVKYTIKDKDRYKIRTYSEGSLLIDVPNPTIEFSPETLMMKGNVVCKAV